MAATTAMIGPGPPSSEWITTTSGARRATRVTHLGAESSAEAAGWRRRPPRTATAARQTSAAAQQRGCCRHAAHPSWCPSEPGIRLHVGVTQHRASGSDPCHAHDLSDPGAAGCVSHRLDQSYVGKLWETAPVHAPADEQHKRYAACDGEEREHGSLRDHAAAPEQAEHENAGRERHPIE